MEPEGPQENGRLEGRKAGQEAEVQEQGTGRVLWIHTWPSSRDPAVNTIQDSMSALSNQFYVVVVPFLH